MPINLQVVQRSESRSDPVTTIRLVKGRLPDSVEGNNVLVDVLYSPVHPSNINILEGTYMYKPEFPFIGGTEASGRVTKVGPDCKNLKAGDLVMWKFASDTYGKWTSHQVCPEDELLKLPEGIDEIQASMLMVNPLTSWALMDPLWTGVPLSKGDWVIQNAGNSAVGQCVIQVCKNLGYRSISLVRRRELFQELKELGADAVFLDEASSVDKIKNLTGEGGTKLALNCVGGDSAQRLLKTLGESSALVTFGAMSRRAFTVKNTDLIFRDIRSLPFHLQFYAKRVGDAKVSAALQRLSEMVAAKQLVQKVDKIFPIEKSLEAMERSMQSKRSGKVVLKCQNEPTGTMKEIEMVVSGIGMRGPGCKTSREFQTRIMNGEDLLETPKRYNAADPKYDDCVPMKTGEIPKVDRFDSQFFHISNVLAEHMLPHTRLALEVAVEAIHNAGLTLATLKGSSTGVFVGNCTGGYEMGLMASKNDLTGREIFAGQSMIPNQISHALDLTGPSEVVDTACSSTIVALDRAFGAITMGLCDRALVIGVQVNHNPRKMLSFSKYKMTSKTGECRCLDVDRNGYALSEGVGGLLIERKELMNQRKYYANLLATSSNSDGYTPKNITYPSTKAQQAVMRDSLFRAKISPDDIQFVEAHLTGTPVGDPVECTSLQSVFGRTNKNPLYVGSVKASAGHCEGASGAMSLLKLMMCYQFGEIAPNGHFNETDIEQVLAGKIKLVTKRQQWNCGPAMTFNYGFGGTNAAAVFTGGNRRMELPTKEQPQIALEPFVLGFSNHENEEEIAEAKPSQAFYTSIMGDQERFVNRFFLDTATNEVVFREQVEEIAPLVFAYGGQGSQEKEMGKWFFDNQPTEEEPNCFRRREEKSHPNYIQEDIFDTFIATITRLSEFVDVDLVAEFKNGDNWHDKILSQVGITAYQVAMTNVLRMFGFSPDYCTYHSAGIVGAMYGAGLIDEEASMKLCFARVKTVQDDLIQHSPFGLKGGMLVVRAAEDALNSVMKLEPAAFKQSSVACLNHPSQTVVSGPMTELTALKNLLRTHKVQSIMLQTDGVAHHAKWMKDFYETVKKGVQARTGLSEQPMGKLVPSHKLHGNSAGPSLVAANVVEACNWVGTVKNLMNRAPDSMFVEISAKPVLTGMMAKLGVKAFPFTTSLKKTTAPTPMARLYEGVRELWLSGHVPRKFLDSVEEDFSFQPNMFDHRKQWPLLGEKEWCGESSGAAEEVVNLDNQFTFLRDHTPNGLQVLPIAFIAEIVWRKCLEGDAGSINLKMLRPTLLEHEKKLMVSVLKTTSKFDVCVTGRSGERVVVAEGSFKKEKFTPTKDHLLKNIPEQPKKMDIIDRVHVTNRLGSKGYDYGKKFQSLDYVVKMDAKEGQKAANAAKLLETDSWLQRLDAALLLPILTRSDQAFVLPVELDIAFSAWKSPKHASNWMVAEIDGFGATADFEIRHAKLQKTERSRNAPADTKYFYEHFEFHSLGDVDNRQTALEGRAFARDIFLDNCKTRVGFTKGETQEMLVVGDAAPWMETMNVELARFVQRSDASSSQAVADKKRFALIVCNSQDTQSTQVNLVKALAPDGFLFLSTPPSTQRPIVDGLTFVKGYNSAEEMLTVWRKPSHTPGATRKNLPFSHWETLKNANPRDFIMTGTHGEGVIGFNRGFQYEDIANYGMMAAYLENGEASKDVLDRVMHFGLRNTFVSPKGVPGIYLGADTKISNQTQKPFNVSSGDVHVVLGGTGDLGLCLAEDLVSRGCVVCLASRSGLKSGYGALITEMLGADKVFVETGVDTTSEESLTALFKRLVARFGDRVNGVWHWAAAFSNTRVKDMTALAFNREMQVKCGAIKLLNKIEKTVLPTKFKHFVVASSVSAQLGGFGMANYCAANQGIEELIRERVRNGLAGKAFQFGFIKYAGWSAVHTEAAAGVNVTKKGSRLNGLDDIPVEIAYKYLFDFLTSGSAICGSAYALNTKKTVASGKAATTAGGETPKTTIWEATMGILGLDPKVDRIKPNFTLSQLGLDSLRREELMAMLESRNVKLSGGGQGLESYTVAQVTALKSN